MRKLVVISLALLIQLEFLRSMHWNEWMNHMVETFNVPMFVRIFGVWLIYQGHIFHMNYISRCHSTHQLQSKLENRERGKINNFIDKIGFILIQNIFTFWSFITTVGSLWSGFWSNAWFGVTQIWATNTAHCWAFTVLNAFRCAWWHLRWQWTFTKV